MITWTRSLSAKGLSSYLQDKTTFKWVDNPALQSEFTVVQKLFLALETESLYSYISQITDASTITILLEWLCRTLLVSFGIFPWSARTLIVAHGLSIYNAWAWMSHDRWDLSSATRDGTCIPLQCMVHSFYLFVFQSFQNYFLSCVSIVFM